MYAWHDQDETDIWFSVQDKIKTKTFPDYHDTRETAFQKRLETEDL